MARASFDSGFVGEESVHQWLLGSESLGLPDSNALRLEILSYCYFLISNSFLAEHSERAGEIAVYSIPSLSLIVRELFEGADESDLAEKVLRNAMFYREELEWGVRRLSSVAAKVMAGDGFLRPPPPFSPRTSSSARRP